MLDASCSDAGPGARLCRFVEGGGVRGLTIIAEARGNTGSVAGPVQYQYKYHNSASFKIPADLRFKLADANRAASG